MHALIHRSINSMKKAHLEQNFSIIQQEGKPRMPAVLSIASTSAHFRRPQWPDVSAIAYSHSTNDDSIEEVLEELKTLSLKDLYNMDSARVSELSSRVHEISTVQFEKVALHGSRYSRVLRRVKRPEEVKPELNPKQM
mmetsp:Transcript_6099/g.10710  ORF Transcript_6099/g.10710 Transcript_6099/m.10710 type:complete len:138 (+) Transcript_6099:293-706(+)